MTTDLGFPEFALDCQDWLVATEADGVLDDEVSERPVLAVLSTVVLAGAAFRSATAVLSLALITAADQVALGASVSGFSSDLHLSDADWPTGHARYVAPAPTGGLALVAEFSSEPHPPLELIARFHELLGSLQWAS